MKRTVVEGNLKILGAHVWVDLELYPYADSNSVKIDTTKEKHMGTFEKKEQMSKSGRQMKTDNTVFNRRVKQKKKNIFKQTSPLKNKTIIRGKRQRQSILKLL